MLPTHGDEVVHTTGLALSSRRGLRARIASAFVLIGFWLCPELRDADRETDDHRDANGTGPQSVAEKDPAGGIDQLSKQIDALIETQKNLTAALSHELKAPLARIRTALAVMRTEDSFTQAEFDAVESDICTMNDLIQQLLEYAQLDHPDRRLHIESAPSDVWLVQAVNRSCAGTPKKSITLDIGDNCREIYIDRKLMELVVSNLMANATRYARDRIIVRFRPLDGEECLSVEDDGVGIASEERESVFAAFRSRDPGASEHGSGSGLGLAIVRRIAELHGGSATATSSELGGARIEVRWPQLAGASTQEQGVEASPFRYASMPAAMPESARVSPVRASGSQSEHRTRHSN